MEPLQNAMGLPIAMLILGIAIGYVLRGSPGYGNHGDDNSSMTVTNNITGDYIESMDLSDDPHYIDPPIRDID